MSTDDFPMPFSVPHKYQRLGAFGLDIPPEYMMPGGMLASSILLPPGRSMVTFSWDGKEGLRYRVERKIGGVWTAGPYRTVIEAGVPGVARTSSPVSIVSAGKLETGLYVQTTSSQSQETIDAGAMASVDVVTIPPPPAGGGGVVSGLLFVTFWAGGRNGHHRALPRTRGRDQCTQGRARVRNTVISEPHHPAASRRRVEKHHYHVGRSRGCHRVHDQLLDKCNGTPLRSGRNPSSTRRNTADGDDLGKLKRTAIFAGTHQGARSAVCVDDSEKIQARCHRHSASNSLNLAVVA